MVTASRIQDMVHIRKKDAYVTTVKFSFLLLGLSASRAPAEGPYPGLGPWLRPGTQMSESRSQPVTWAEVTLAYVTAAESENRCSK